MPAGQGRIKGSADERAAARGRLRLELLTAARAIAEESGGSDKLTVRSVADRVGYTAPIVYEYFANKRALLLGLIEVGFSDLALLLEKSVCAHTTERSDRLAAIAAAYWDFAAANPQLYRLMHTLPDVPFGTRTTPTEAQRCFGLLKAAVSGTGAQTPDGDDAADMFWAQLHGMVSLALDNRVKDGPERARALLIEHARLFASVIATP